MRVHRRGMDAACRGGGAIAGIFSGVEPTVRRDPFGVLGRDCDRDDRTLPGSGECTCNWTVDASVRVLCVCRSLTSLPSKVPPHTSPSLLVTVFTPVVVEVPKPLEDITAIAGPATRDRKSTVPPSLGLEEPFPSKPLLWSRSSTNPGGTDFAHTGRTSRYRQ